MAKAAWKTNWKTVRKGKVISGPCGRCLVKSPVMCCSPEGGETYIIVHIHELLWYLYHPHHLWPGVYGVCASTFLPFSHSQKAIAAGGSHKSSGSRARTVFILSHFLFFYFGSKSGYFRTGHRIFPAPWFIVFKQPQLPEKNYQLSLFPYNW